MQGRGLVALAASAMMLVSVAGAARADEDPRAPAAGVVDPGPSTDWTLQPQKARGNEPPVWVYAPPPPPPPAPAFEPRREPHEAAKDQASIGGLELSIGPLTFAQSLRGVTFNGEGVPIVGNPQRVQFHHSGQELGLDAPSFWGGEVQVHYLRRYFAIGGVFYYMGHPGGSDATPQPAHSIPASQVDTSSLTGLGGGLDVAGALPLGDYVTIRPGMLLSARSFSMPISGFQITTCRSKGRSYPCDEKATSDTLFAADARLAIHFTPSPKGELFLGGFVGMNVLDGTPSYGLVIGIGSSHASLLP